ncbi:MAG: glycerate kinase [Novosphingobium sp.]
MRNRQLLADYFLHGVAASSPRLTLPAALPAAPPRGRTIVLGCGKAAAEMALVASECLAGPVSGCVVTRHGHNVANPPATIEIIEARHPVPDGLSLEAGRRLLRLAAEAGPDDRVIFLISGGGSSLLCAPADGLSFESKQAISDWLVRSGAGIAEINLVRRHLSRIKGGRLAAVAGARGAELLTCLISDVAGDDPALIASGPSIGAPFEPDAALTVLARAGWDVAPDLANVIHANRPPEVAPHPVRMLATNADALQAVSERATRDGWNVVNLGGDLSGHAAETGRSHAAIARDYCSRPGRHLLVSGGELTVLRASAAGRGGPNLEYLTGLLAALSPADPIEALAGDSDGIDGTEDNAGGYITASWADPQAAGQALAVNRSYDLFERLGGLIKTGPTRTNVNDIRMIAVEGPRP